MSGARPIASAGEAPAASSARDVRIDALRGLAIILVVLGHAIYEAAGKSSADPVFRTIYSFHMPLFAAVSGYLWARGAGRPGWLRRRLVGLRLPYLGWVLVGMAVGWPVASPSSAAAVVSRVRDALLGLGSGGGLWFLYALFWSALIVWALRRWEWLLVAAALALLLKPWMPDVGFVNQLRWTVLPFVVGGYLIGVHKPRGAKWAAAVSLAAFPVLLWVMWPIIEQPAWVGELTRVLGSSWPAWLVRVRPDGVANGVFWLGRCAVAAAGIGVTVPLVRRLPDAALRTLATFGVASLGIYASHFMWQSWLLGLAPLSAVPLFVLSLGLALATALVLARIPVVRTVLLGIRGSKAA